MYEWQRNISTHSKLPCRLWYKQWTITTLSLRCKWMVSGRKCAQIPVRPQMGETTVEPMRLFKLTTRTMQPLTSPVWDSVCFRAGENPTSFVYLHRFFHKDMEISRHCQVRLHTQHKIEESQISLSTFLFRGYPISSVELSQPRFWVYHWMSAPRWVLLTHVHRLLLYR